MLAHCPLRAAQLLVFGNADGLLLPLHLEAEELRRGRSRFDQRKKFDTYSESVPVRSTLGIR